MSDDRGRFDFGLLIILGVALWVLLVYGFVAVMTNV